MKIVFIGTSRFAAIILEGLIKNNHRPVLVITETDKPSGRKKEIAQSEVKLMAQKNNLKILQPEKIIDAESELKKINPDIIILSAYGQIIPKNILEIPKYGALNVHPSLLPKYRGASPVQTAILNGDKETGVTIYFMDEKMDHGPIISQKTFEVSEGRNFQGLKEDLAKIGVKLLIEALPKLKKNEIKATPQNESLATYTKIITKEDGHINWDNSAHQIERMLRAYQKWPGIWTIWEKNDKKAQRIKILAAEVKKLPENKDQTGYVVISPENELLITCRDNYLKVLELQLEGKNPMSAQEFLKGHKDIIGTILK